MSEPNETTHLTPYFNGRGFKQMPSLLSKHGGGVRVYESSNAVAPHIWLEAGSPNSGGVVETATTHLSLDNAAKLRDQLTYLIENHYQLPRPQPIEGESE